jgi:glycosyltransferase involved in cell wall biosynthesis
MVRREWATRLMRRTTVAHTPLGLAADRAARLAPLVGARWPVVALGRGEAGLVSVVIPVRNRVDLLVAAVESALAQEAAPVEVVVVDDGSTDDVAGKLARFGASVHLIRQPNRGVTAARNAGLRHVRGEFVAFLDSDDVWRPGKLAAQLAVLRACPEAGMVWTDMAAVTPDGTLRDERYLRTFYAGSYAGSGVEASLRAIRLGDVWPESPAAVRDVRVLVGDIFAAMFFGNHVHTSTVLLRRKRLQATGGFDERFPRTGEDYEFHWRTSFLGPVALLDEPFVDYRVGAADQLTSAAWQLEIARNARASVVLWMELAGPELTLPAAARRHRLAELDAWVGEAALACDDPAAWTSLVRSVGRRPNRVRPWLLLALSCLPAFLRRGLLRLRRSRRGSPDG